MVMRDRRRLAIEASELVPGDVLLIEEGERISADARLIAGGIEVDSSTRRLRRATCYSPYRAQPLMVIVWCWPAT